MDRLTTILRHVSWQAVVVAVAGYFVALALYRLFLHPLARFPGPRLAAVTRWYEGYYDVVLGGQYAFKIAELHKKYGPIVRISPHELHVHDAGFYEQLYSRSGRWDKYAWAVDANGKRGSSLFTPDHDVHKHRRQPLNGYFSKARVATQHHVIERHVQRLCERVRAFAEGRRVIDLGAAVSALQRDMTIDFVLGWQCDDVEKDDFAVDLSSTMQGGGILWRVTKHVPCYATVMLALPKRLLVRINKDMASYFRYEQELKETTRQLLEMETRRASSASVEKDETTRANVVRDMVRSKLPAEEKTLERVFDEVVTVAGAGFETTASILRLVLYHVYTDATILGQLRHELARAFPDGGAMHAPALEQLPYLTAVLKEAMRLSPAISARMGRVARDRDLVYGRWRIPAGTVVGMTTLLLHLDETQYPEPHRFVPERWTDAHETKTETETETGTGASVYAPFSRGTRICLGMHLPRSFAWAELYWIVATLVRRFDFDFAGVPTDHFDWVDDRFIIGFKGKTSLPGRVSLHQPCGPAVGA